MVSILQIEGGLMFLFFVLGEIDCISCLNPIITVHECKYKVDGITKYIDNQDFKFDNSFSHDESNEEVYFFSIRPVID
jgi:kinesin family protein 2/24